MPEYEGKYLFVSNVRTGETLASQILAYDTAREAEIKYHQEVAYGLQLDTITLAHYFVMNEYGVVVNNLITTIDNIPSVEEPEA